MKWVQAQQSYRSKEATTHVQLKQRSKEVTKQRPVGVH